MRRLGWKGRGGNKIGKEEGEGIDQRKSKRGWERKRRRRGEGYWKGRI